MSFDRKDYEDCHESREYLYESFPDERPRHLRRLHERMAERAAERQETKATCEGCGKRLPLIELERTADGYLCDTCLYGYKRVMAVCK